MTRAQSAWSTPAGWSTYTQNRVGESELDREHLDARQVVLDARDDLARQLLSFSNVRRPAICALLSQKMGPQAHFAEPVKMVSRV